MEAVALVSEARPARPSNASAAPLLCSRRMPVSIAISGSFWRESQSVKAEESLRKAIEVTPNYALSHYELGKLLGSPIDCQQRLRS